MKKLLTVSLLAMMAVGTARADIASTSYADKVAANAQSAAISTAAEDAATKANTAETNAKKAASDALAAAKTELEGKITAETTRATNAETALGARIDDISAGELTIKENAVTAFEIKDGEVKTDEIADAAVTKAKLSEDVQASLDKADAAAPQATTYTKTEVDNALALKESLSNKNLADDETAATAEYPSTKYMKAFVNDSMTDNTTNIAANTAAIAAINNATTGIAAKAAADATTKADAAEANAKGYTDTLANGAVKANTDHIGTLGSLTTTAKTNLVGAINEVDSDATQALADAAAAQADATQALADAAAAQGTADEAMNFDELKNDASWSTAKCGEANAVCSLVAKNGSIAWERVQP